jgi:hypothetical protein
MQEPESLDGAERELAEALGSLQPAPIRTSQREIWYEAGFQAGRRGQGVWKGMAAMLMLLSGSLLISDRRPAPTASERIVYVRQEPPALSKAVPTAEQNRSIALAVENLRLRDAIIRDGWNALPIARSGGGSSQSSRPDPLTPEAVKDLLPF